MKRYKYLDVILVCLVGAILCVFVCARIVTKEVLIDKWHLSMPVTDYILYDLNTTIEIPATETDKRSSSIGRAIDEGKHKLTAYTTSAMIFNKQINQIVTCIDSKLRNVPSTLSNRRYIAAPSENVIDFAHFVEEENIPFLYISTPNYDSVMCRAGAEDLYEYRLSECSWYLLQNLKDAGVATIDLAQGLADAKMTKYDLSGHWFPENALYAAGIVAEQLNQYGFEFDLSMYDGSNCTDYFEEKEEWKRTIYENSGYVYSFPIPNRERDMIFTLEHDGTISKGTFDEVFLKAPEAYTEAAYHGFSVVTNSTLHKYHNLSACDNKGKKILIIGDSFNWILADYLIADIEYLDVIHNASFEESIRSYIKETKPDMVLIIYNDAEFVEVYTEQAYNFE